MHRQSKKVVIDKSTSRRIVEQSHARIWQVGFVFILFFVSIAFRMIEVAVIDNPKALTVTVFDLDDESENREVNLDIKKPILSRGNIVDRNGTLLATGLITSSAYVRPDEVINVGDAAVKLATALSLSKKKVLRNLKSKKRFVWIKRNLTPKEQKEVNSFGIPGVYFAPSEKRVYPYGNLFSHLIGYVNIDNKGRAGIEQQFNRRLLDESINNEPLELSVDVRLQAMMHSELLKTVKEFKALGAAGVISNIKSGEVLAMVSLPDFNPHKPPICHKKMKPEECRKFNRVSFGTYEMGSTFKSFTMAMGLEYGVRGMKGGYDATEPLRISSSVIRDSHARRRWLSVPEIYAYSSNVGTAKMALDVGGKRQKEFMKNLGMFERFDIEIPERASPAYPSDWKDINTVTISYGHGISVTPLHLVRGISAIVGGGIIKNLTLLKDGNKSKNDSEHRIISDKTSKNIRRLMRLVVEYGTARSADVPGYRVGGKTGTAEKIIGGKYDRDKKMVSFVGVFPVDDPQYVVFVMVDEPKGNKSTHGFATGGWIAAPIVRNIIEMMGPMMGIKPRYDVPEDDADKFWVDDNKNKNRGNNMRNAAGASINKRYISAASY
ncbi:MAG: penicillin-binding protein 2 [Rickettsiales bacterium]